MPRSLARIRLVALLIVAIAVGACGSDGPPSGLPAGSPPDGALSFLSGTSWIVVTVNGRSPLPGAVPTVVFAPATVDGFAGCNQFGGSYQFDAASGRFATSEIGATAMGCLQAGVMEFETAFLTTLGGSSRAALDATGQLILGGPGTRIVLVILEHPATSG